MLAGDINVSAGAFYALVVALACYALLTVWAVVDTIRRGRVAWTAAVVILGPIGLVAWIARRVLDRRADSAAGIKRPVGL